MGEKLKVGDVVYSTKYDHLSKHNITRTTKTMAITKNGLRLGIKNLREIGDSPFHVQRETLQLAKEYIHQNKRLKALHIIGHVSFGDLPNKTLFEVVALLQKAQKKGGKE